ncbi:differentially expressed in FDCP 8 homolog A-like isoform X2 [Watersipora subatra]|uniref:differentially expressed in FDCP 8 homolog A-like isoform X2 n=1 Tax=Watersipora subatra TaxID=2589382 RepID=UPI00355B9637
MMATSGNRPVATIKFFKPSNGESDSEDSDEDYSNNQRSESDSLKTNPFDDSILPEREGESSIYDSQLIKDLDIPTSTKQRSDSESNYFEVESVPEEPLSLNMREDYFGLPEDLSRLKDIEQEIQKIKDLIYRTPDENTAKRQLIQKLVGLRLRKSELEGEQGNSVDSQAKCVYGHEFHLKESTTDTGRHCEVCCAVVWGVIGTWYTCTSCHICCHDRCLNSLKRMCASKKLTEPLSYVMSICRDRGLASQNYKCFECQCGISYKLGAVEPRQCDYTGSYYCPSCHWNDEMIIPARVVHNWDFVPRKVCRASKQYLNLMYRKPALRMETINKHLLNFVEELSEVKKLRQEILLMKTYFLSCQAAMQSKLLLLLKERQHFVENSEFYTMHDLDELVNERLLPVIINIHASFACHIKVDCATCRGKGYFCEICRKSEIIFPFDNVCVLCKECSNVFHKYCFAKVHQNCPRCERKKKRLQENERKAQILRQIEEANSS